MQDVTLTPRRVTLIVVWRQCLIVGRPAYLDNVTYGWPNVWYGPPCRASKKCYWSNISVPAKSGWISKSSYNMIDHLWTMLWYHNLPMMLLWTNVRPRCVDCYIKWESLHNDTHSTETLSSGHAKYDHHSTSVSRYTI